MESSDEQSAVTSLLTNNYAALVIVTALGYDHILTFSDEVEYIWNKPWTLVSTLFVLVRYCGLCGVIVYCLVGTTFIPGPNKVLTMLTNVSRRPNRCEIVSTFSLWGLFVLASAMQMIMLLRVWALYCQSRIVLGILLVLFAMNGVTFLVEVVALSASNTKQVVEATAHVSGHSYCQTGGDAASGIWADVNEILRLVLATVMGLLVVIQYLRQLLQMYKVTKQWQIGQYVTLFIRDSVSYFLVFVRVRHYEQHCRMARNVVFEVISLFSSTANWTTPGWRVFLLIKALTFLPVFTLTPRFVLNVRVLYTHGVRGRNGPCGLDTGFGFASVSRRTGIVSIRFADLEDGSLESTEEIPFEEEEQR